VTESPPVMHEALTASELLKSHGIQATKSLGQNFLLDMNITAKIVRLSGIKSGDRVIEVGPGCGSLTIPMLQLGASVMAIEKDSRMISVLSEIQRHYPQTLEFITDDALKFDYSNLSMRFHILSNLPYNISTELLVKWLKHLDNINSMTLMFQKEVADRIIAKPRTKAYGRLSIMSQWLCDVRPLLTLPPSAFTPKPKIDSTVLHFIPKQPYVDFATILKMEHLLKIAFQNRRKMLRSISSGISAAFENAGITLTSRAEELSVEDYIKVCKCI